MKQTHFYYLFVKSVSTTSHPPTYPESSVKGPIDENIFQQKLDGFPIPFLHHFSLSPSTREASICLVSSDIPTEKEGRGNLDLKPDKETRGGGRRRSGTE